MSTDAHRSQREFLEQDSEQLLADCDVQTYKASGPGGQHRNKTTSAVRLRHRPSEVVTQSADSRSQHENRRRALKRLRIEIACQVRRPVDKLAEPPAPLREALQTSHKGPQAGKARLEISRKNDRWPLVAAILLDVLQAYEGRVSDAATYVGVSTSNLIRTLKQDRHVFTAAQQIRKDFDQKPLT